MKDQQNLDHYEPSKFKVSVLFIYLFLLKKTKKFELKYSYVSRIKEDSVMIECIIHNKFL